jgi:hypothetical protein
MPTKLQMFEQLARKANLSKDAIDIRFAIRFGIENRISNKKIRESL